VPRRWITAGADGCPAAVCRYCRPLGGAGAWVDRLRSTAGRRPGGRLPVSALPVVDDAVMPGAWSLAARVPLALVPDSPMLPWSCFDSCLPCSRCHVTCDPIPGREQTAAGPGVAAATLPENNALCLDVSISTLPESILID
jgi:hypothetical protein